MNKQEKEAVTKALGSLDPSVRALVESAFAFKAEKDTGEARTAILHAAHSLSGLLPSLSPEQREEAVAGVGEVLAKWQKVLEPAEVVPEKPVKPRKATS